LLRTQKNNVICVLAKLYSLVVRFVAPDMGSAVDEPSAVERHYPPTYGAVPRHPGVFIPQIHRHQCGDYEC
jgi:hypothetical protein